MLASVKKKVDINYVNIPSSHLIDLHYLLSSANTDMFNVDRMHQRTVICGLIFVVGVWKLVKFILKWQFIMVILNKPDRSLHVCQKM